MALRITRNGNQLCDLISFIYQYSVSQGKLIIFWSCHLILIVNLPVHKKQGWFHWFLSFLFKEYVIMLPSFRLILTRQPFTIFYISHFTDSIHHYLLQIFCRILIQLSEWYCKTFLSEKAYFFWYFNTQVSYKLDSSSGTRRNHKTGQP